MLEAYPLVPLFPGQALGIALFSYAENLFWGFNADWDSLSDLRYLVDAVEASLVELQQAAVRPRKLVHPHRRRGETRRLSTAKRSGSQWKARLKPRRVLDDGDDPVRDQGRLRGVNVPRSTESID